MLIDQAWWPTKQVSHVRRQTPFKRAQVYFFFSSLILSVAHNAAFRPYSDMIHHIHGQVLEKIYLWGKYDVFPVTGTRTITPNVKILGRPRYGLTCFDVRSFWSAVQKCVDCWSDKCLIRFEPAALGTDAAAAARLQGVKFFIISCLGRIVMIHWIEIVGTFQFLTSFLGSYLQ